MVSLPFPQLRAAWRHLWNSDRLAPFRFYGFYLRWPLALALLALVGEKLIFYGGMPLETRLAREWSYFQAERDFSAGRDRDALFRIRQALVDTRDDAKLWRLAAKISDRLHSPEAPYCWEQADRLEPGAAATELALARSALERQEWDLAGAALREVEAGQQAGVEWLVDSGRLAAAEDEPERARYFFTQAEALQPRDLEALFALADGHAGLSGHADAERARAILTGLATRNEQRLEALRKLVALELRQGDLAAARETESELVATPGAGFTDRLRELDVVHDPVEVESKLNDLLGAVSREDAPAVLDWMTHHGRAEEALIWIRRRDEAWQDGPAIGLARARCLAALGEWTHLRDDQRDSTWPGRESARLMLLAEASWQLGNEDDAEAAWHRAVAACAEPVDFTELADAAATFLDGGQAQAEVWLALANRFPGQQWPQRQLLRYELARGDLVMAQQLAERLAALEPEDAAVNATRDLLCLLRGTATRQAGADLAHLDALAPEDPTVATAEAYALYLDGHFDDALAAIGALSPGELRAPERAVYVGQLLAAAGPVGKAEEALRAAQAQPILLDGQRNGLDRALALVAYRRAMTELLAGDATSRRQACGFFLDRAPAGEPVFVIGAAVALLPDRSRAAGMLARIDPLALNRVELELDEGAVLALAGPATRATSYLELANGLPAETPLAVWIRIVNAWWELVDRGGFNLAAADGLLSAYRGLENAGPAADFWRSDESRETKLTRAALENGALGEQVQGRLEALLRHVPATPEIEAEVGYALFLQGRVEAGRQRLEVLTEADLRRPEPACYYAAILRACGETKRADAYALLASREGEPRKAL